MNRKSAVVGVTTQFNDIPALSTTLWYAGCKLRCGGCQNTELENFRSGLSFEVVEHILKERRKMTDWLVHLGGNPVDSLESLLTVVAIGARLGYRQFLYTGYELGELKTLLTKEQEEFLLCHIEFLKTGRYDACMKRKENNSFYFETLNQRVFKSTPTGWEVFYDTDSNRPFNYDEVNA